MNKTTPEYQRHGERLIYVNHYLNSNPNFFNKEELAELRRYRELKRSSYFELGLYFLFLLIGRNPPQLSKNGGPVRIIFSSAR